MVVKKITAVLLAMVFCFGTLFVMPANAAEEEAKLTEVSIVYAPLLSRVVYDQIGPELSGMVLRFRYSDGRSETATVRREGNTFKAGDYSVGVFLFYLTAMGQIGNYGYKSTCVTVSDGENEVQSDFWIVSVPSPLEFVNCIKNLIKIYLFRGE